jgi:hypothetical protein
LPTIAPYFFTEPEGGAILDPALSKEQEAYGMFSLSTLRSLFRKQNFAGKVVRHSADRFSRVGSQWDREEILDVVHKIGHEVEAVNPRLVMRILRHAITGVKV